MKTTIAVLVITFMLIGASASAAVPPMISYQGKLMQPSGAAVPDGSYSIQFAIYAMPTGGTALWSETNPSVQVKGGLFSVLLGSVTNLPANIFDNPSIFFGVTVGSDPEMTPRQQIASVAYAQMAGSVPDGSITTAKLADQAVTVDKLMPGAATATGTISMFAGSTPPAGWLICDGSAISRSTYSTLFGVIGAAYGAGDGATTFNLPNLQGRVPFGQSSDPQFATLGQTGGEKTHQLTIAEMPSHDHGYSASCNGYMVPQGSYYGLATCNGPTNVGGDQPHNVLNPYLVVNYIIKY